MSSVHAMPGHLVRRLQQISVARFTEECGAYSLTSVQFAALTAIGENPGLDATRLSAIIAFDRSTIGDVLERLDGKGWIARRPSATDRRARTLTLTQAGRDVLDAVLPSVERVQERLLAPLDETDRAQFVALLARLVDLHGTAPGPEIA